MWTLARCAFEDSTNTHVNRLAVLALALRLGGAEAEVGRQRAGDLLLRARLAGPVGAARVRCGLSWRGKREQPSQLTVAMDSFFPVYPLARAYTHCALLLGGVRAATRDALARDLVALRRGKTGRHLQVSVAVL